MVPKGPAYVLASAAGLKIGKRIFSVLRSNNLFDPDMDELDPQSKDDNCLSASFFYVFVSGPGDLAMV